MIPFTQKKIYKDQVENMLVNHVFTEFASEHGYLRARVSSSVNSLMCLSISYSYCQVNSEVIFGKGKKKKGGGVLFLESCVRNDTLIQNFLLHH